jgi:hypothetical protein
MIFQLLGPALEKRKQALCLPFHMTAQPEALQGLLGMSKAN